MCTGPSMWSPPTKTILSQNWLLVPGIGLLSLPSRRNFVHCEYAPVSAAEGFAKP